MLILGVVYIRGSVHVKLVTALDVKHEITSVQILHYEKQVFLDVRTQMSLGMWFLRRVTTLTDERSSECGRYLGLEGAVKVCEEGVFPS